MAEKKDEEGHRSEKWYQEMRQKVHDYVERVKMDHTIKKLLKKDPVAVLLAADIGFATAAEVQDYLFWQVFGGW